MRQRTTAQQRFLLDSHLTKDLSLCFLTFLFYKAPTSSCFQLLDFRTQIIFTLFKPKAGDVQSYVSFNLTSLYIHSNKQCRVVLYLQFIYLCMNMSVCNALPTILFSLISPRSAAQKRFQQTESQRFLAAESRSSERGSSSRPPYTCSTVRDRKQPHYNQL